MTSFLALTGAMFAASMCVMTVVLALIDDLVE